MKIKSILFIAFALLYSNSTLLAQTVPSYVPTNGLIGWWPFTGNANDASGNGNHGTVLGASLNTDRFSQVNSAYLFDGVDALNKGISLPNSLNNNGSYSISIWFQLADSNKTILTPAQCIISSNPHASLAVGYGHPYYPFRMGACLGDGSSWLQCSPSSDIEWDLNGKLNWHNLVVVKSLTNYNFYIDGISNYNFSTTTSYNTGIFSLILGAINVSTGEVFNGKLDDVAIWNRTLTPTEITALYTATGCGLSITTQPSSQTINQNKAAQFVVASTDPAATYQWQTDLGNGFVNIQDQGKFSGTNNDTLAISAVRICNNNQAFRCIVTSGTCADTSAVASLSVNYDETCIDSNATVGDPLAVFTSEKVACSTQLNFTNLSINGIVSAWDFGDPASGSDNTSNASNPSHVFSAAGTYAVTLIAKDGPGCSDTMSRSVVVSAPGLAPVANFTAQIDSGACISKVRFSNTSSNATQYVWIMADGSENKQENPSIAFPLAGTYAVKLAAISATGCTDTLEQNIVINRNSSGAVAKFAANDSVQCFANHSFNFNNQSMFYGPGYNANYTWDFGDGTTNTTNTFVFNKQYAAAGVYTVSLIAQSPGGCADTAYQTVRVIPSADANFTATIGCSQTVRIGHPLDANTTYIWNFGDGNYDSHALDTFNHTYYRVGQYTISLTAYLENGCASTVQVSTYASDGNNPIANFSYVPTCGNNILFDNLTQFGSGFLWNFGDGSPVVTDFEPYHSFPTAGTYNVTLTTFKSPTCTNTITLPVVAPQGWNIKLPRAKFAYYVHPCTNVITLKDSSSLESVNFTWYVNRVLQDTGAQINIPALTPGTYEIMLVADNVFCTDTAVAGIKIQEAPEALFELTTDACSNTILVTNASKNANTFAWDFGDAASANNTASGASASHTYASNGTYTIRLIAFNLTGCSDTISLPVTLTNAAAASKANFNYTYGLCNCKCDNYIKFRNLSPGTNSYLWTFGDGSTSVQQDFVKGFPQGGSYQVTLTVVDSVGCMSTLTKTIEIDATVSGPSASFNTDHQVQCLDRNSFNFYNTSSHVGQGWIKKYYWYFGDGTMDSTNSFVYNKKYTNAGNYIVTLVAVNAEDCRDTMTMYVQVRALPCSGVLKFVNLKDGSNWNIDPRLNDAGMVNGVTVLSAQSQYSMHPNPSTGNFSIQFKDPINQSISVSIIDILGKQVYQKTYAPSGLTQLQVEAENLAAGTYLLQLATENQTYKDQKFVVIK